MEKENVFKWKHYQPDIILLTIRWVHQYGPELNERIRNHLKSTNASRRVDEIYIQIKGEQMYLYRTTDSQGNTIDFYLGQRRNAKAAKRFLKKALVFCHATKPHTITADGDKAYPVAIRKLKEEKRLLHCTPLRVKKYLNNIIEQEHRFIKKRIRNMLGLKLLQTARKMIDGIEAMHMIKKGKTSQGMKSVRKQIQLIDYLFGLSA
ncbi:IS6 family transposase [Bacillus thuringiensis]|nr:IS6 family transposase [Bacillus thuringiensis]MED2784343.1 IS6 family transposase [Bacillus thuringiensis]